MAKRLSSIFSLGSAYSDRTQSSTDSRQPSSDHPARPSREQSPAHLASKSTPNLRPSDNLQSLHNEQSSGLTPPFDPTLLPHLEDDHPMLRPQQFLLPVPLRPKSPIDSLGEGRPVSRGRPQSGGDSSLQASPAFLKPLPLRSESPGLIRPQSSAGSHPYSQPGSRPSSRPASPIKSRPQTPTAGSKISNRRTWMPGKAKGGSHEEVDQAGLPQAWTVTPQEKFKYDATPLATFQQVPELWNENGDTLVYLHAQECGRGPSFKIDSSLFASSRKLVQAAYGEARRGSRGFDGRSSDDEQQRSFVDRVQNLSVNPPISPATSQPGSSTKGSSKDSRKASHDFFESLPLRKDIHLCLPMPLQANLTNPQAQPTMEDVETLLTVRNVFAFLAGLPLVATPKQSSVFTIFLKIADIMQRYEFTNLDGSTLGEEAAGSLAKSIEDFKLADVRSSREKTIEAIVLGERMRSLELYNEGFVHAVGKYEDISGLKSPKYHLISDLTRKRLERAHLDLDARVRNVQTRLEDFDFPSIFAGVASSSTSSDSKVINFKDWRSAYVSMRKHVMSLYRNRYGAWPPKAKSKKNNFEESGLNRLLLQELYQDFSDLYDILVDRTSLTTRSAGLSSQDGPDDSTDPTPRALRRVMDEYDRSTPPVQPPIPFDLPVFPSLSFIRRDFSSLDPKKQRKERMKKLGDDEINRALMQSYNRDSVKSTPFLEAFMAHERRSAHGKSIDEIADLRSGQWLFIYVVLQALPLMVVDAPGVKWTRGVEYFLCEVPRGSAPWIQESQSRKQAWYGIAGGSGLVSLPADIVEHGVDGIYRRSHCWQAAEKWAGYSDVVDHPHPSQYAQQQQPYEEQLMPPPSTLPGMRPESRTSARSPDLKATTSLGLEQLPLPPGVTPSGARPTSLHDPNKTFGAILAQTNGMGKKKK